MSGLPLPFHLFLLSLTKCKCLLQIKTVPSNLLDGLQEPVFIVSRGLFGDEVVNLTAWVELGWTLDLGQVLKEVHAPTTQLGHGDALCMHGAGTIQLSSIRAQQDSMAWLG